MDWKKTLVPPNTPLRDAIKAVDVGALQICLVVDDRGCLLGTVTDGDIRRGILRNLDMATPVSRVMNATPQTGVPAESNEILLARMTTHVVRHIPLLDGQRRVVGLASMERPLSPDAKRDNWVVLMAGGLGRRLRPLTDNMPKPLLPVGDKPLLETILERFLAHGFRRFYISVNYKADAIKDYFADGTKWGAEIVYINEKRPLGTAGGLGLIEERPDTSLIVMNGDLLTEVNFVHLLDYHRQYKSKATMCVREYDFRVPFGVVEIDGNRIRSIDEKPLHRFLVNAGIYVLEPHLIDLVPRGRHFDITALFERIVEAGQNTAVFPIREYWLDIGRFVDLDRANYEFNKVSST